VKGVSVLSLSTILVFDFGIVLLSYSLLWSYLLHVLPQTRLETKLHNHHLFFKREVVWNSIIVCHSNTCAYLMYMVYLYHRYKDQWLKPPPLRIEYQHASCAALVSNVMTTNTYHYHFIAYHLILYFDRIYYMFFHKHVMRLNWISTLLIFIHIYHFNHRFCLFLRFWYLILELFPTVWYFLYFILIPTCNTTIIYFSKGNLFEIQ
jgi:hypothetical protein